MSTYAERHPDATPEVVTTVADILHDYNSGAYTARKMDKAHALAVRTGAVNPPATSFGWLA